MKNRHVNIPVFIPHLGCPNMCVFCNQRSISGKMNFELASVRPEIEAALSGTREGDDIEIAFFGGSFTGIDRSLMIELLGTAQSYIDGGRVSRIRLSTRPDYIDDEILDILSRYSVKTIELGLQSMDDRVLAASKRGHDSHCAERACRMIKARGFELVGQMMTGLPGSTVESEIYTAERICALEADGARIYPTVVFRGTELCDMAENGSYVPLSLPDAVERSKEALKVFDRYGVRCIRVGLCATEQLFSDAVYGGPNHGAVGEMVMNALYYDKIESALKALTGADSTRGAVLTVSVAPGAVSKAVGQHGCNRSALIAKYGLKRVGVVEKPGLKNYEIEIEITKSDEEESVTCI